jgi:hypothetical protein
LRNILVKQNRFKAQGTRYKAQGRFKLQEGRREEKVMKMKKGKKIKLDDASCIQ